MIEKIAGWFRSLVRAILQALFPGDLLDRIRQAAAGGGAESMAEPAGRDTDRSPRDVPKRELSEEERSRMRETPVERRHIRFYGRVQGVGFRYHAMRDARNQGLTGWVANLPDGSVEMEIQGPSKVIDYVLENLENGSWIRIDGIESERIPVLRDEKGFQVRGF